MIPRFSAVLFDCDGVLVDSELITNSVLRTMLLELGWEIGVQDCLEIFIGKALKDQWEPIFAHTGFRIDGAWLTRFRARRDDALRSALAPIDGAAHAVAVIAKTYGSKIACATGADRGKVEMQLSVTGLAPWFGDRVFSGMEYPRSKPAPDVYLAAAAALQIDPLQALVIEDTVTGVTAGVAAGATVFGFANGGPSSTAAEDLLAAGASRIFSSMDQLHALTIKD